MRDKHGIDLTQCGQPRAYADSEYVGTVEAESEEEAREKLVTMCHGAEILEKRSQGDDWHKHFFREFQITSPGIWKFHITLPSTS